MQSLTRGAPLYAMRGPSSPRGPASYDAAFSTNETPPHRCCAFYWDFLERPDDPPLQRLRKQVLTLICLSLGISFTVAYLLIVPGADWGFTFDNGWIWTWLMVIQLGSIATWFVWMCATRAVSDRLLYFVAATTALMALLGDFETAVHGHMRRWPALIVLLDVLLLMKTGKRAANAVVGVSIAYFVVVAVESDVRFGLFDVDGTTQEKYDRLCGCATPPCSTGTSAYIELINCVFVLGLDFAITRKFATQMYDERDRVERAVVLAQSVVESLVRFDLETARTTLDGESAISLPPALCTAYHQLLANLAAYRPYLPLSLIECVDNVSPAPSTGKLSLPDSPPQPVWSLCDGDKALVAVMFTDIRNSTKIWRQCPSGMKAALKQHNQAIREVVSAHSGYEVKTIGDAFMLTFPDALNAVRCALDVQETLLRLEWPAELLHLPECARDARELWGGLTVRIGLDYGPADTELNVRTNRWDFYGDTVNIAARIENICPPGCVAGRAEVMAGVMEALGTDVCSDMGSASMDLKGYGETTVQTVVPQRLLARRDYPYDAAVAVVNANPFVSRDTMSTASGSTGGFFVHQPIAALQNLDTFKAAMVSTACVNFDLSHVQDVEAAENLQTVFEDVLRCLAMTSGSVVTTVHSLVVLSWTVHAHAEEAARFVSLLLRSGGGHPWRTPEDETVSRRSRLAPPVSTGYRVCTYHAGVSSGRVFTGAVGGERQRFMTSVGPALTVSMQLLREAETCGRQVLFASPTVSRSVLQYPPQVGLELRQVGPMEVRVEGGHDTVQVYEMCLAWRIDAGADAELERDRQPAMIELPAPYMRVSSVL